MNIFEKRPLCLILCIMLGAFSLFMNVEPLWVIVGAGLAILLFILTFVFKDVFRKKALTRALAVAFLTSIVLGRIFLFTFNPDKIYGYETNIEGIVYDIDNTDGSSSSFTLKTERIGTHKVSLSLYVVTDKEEISGVSNGDRITFNGTVEEFRNAINGFNERAYYSSRGFSGRVFYTSDLQITEAGVKSTTSVFNKIQSRLSNVLRLATDERTGGFLAALIMGEQSTLDDNIALNFRLIGISHILALSGMHLVIICGGVSAILARMRINKKIIVIISTVLALFYMAITGFSAPVVRSAVMLSITNVLYLLLSTHDSYTTLPLSVVIILIFQPYAVYDISLWLSAFATLGLLVFSDWHRRTTTYTKPNLPIYILNALSDGIFATIFAIGASYIIMVFCFDTTSLLAPITTLIFSLPINIMIYMGFAVILLYPFIPVGHIVVWYTDIVLWGAELVARIDMAILSTDFLLVEALIIIFSVYFFTVIIVKLKRLTAAIAVMLVLFSSIYATALAFTTVNRYTDESYFTSEKRSDAILVKDGGISTLIHTGNCSEDSAEFNLDLLNEEKVMTLDNLLLTTYTYNSFRYVEEVVSTIKTDRLYIPKPYNNYELSIAEAIANRLSRFGTYMKFYSPEETLEFSKVCYMLVDRTECTSDVTSDTIFFLTMSGERYSYFTTGASRHMHFKANAIASASDYLIFGAYGSGYSTASDLNFYSERLKSVVYVSYLPLSDNAKSYYESKEVPIEKIGTSYFIR